MIVAVPAWLRERLINCLKKLYFKPPPTIVVAPPQRGCGGAAVGAHEAQPPVLCLVGVAVLWGAWCHD